MLQHGSVFISNDSVIPRLFVGKIRGPSCMRVFIPNGGVCHNADEALRGGHRNFFLVEKAWGNGFLAQD